MLETLKECGLAVLWVCAEGLRFLVGPIMLEQQQPARFRLRAGSGKTSGL